MSNVSSMRQKLQNASDTAALTGAVKTGTQDQRRADALAALNVNLSPNTARNIELATVDFSADGNVIVSVRSTYDTMFLGIIGRHTISPTVTSIASSYVSGNDMRCVHALNTYDQSTLIFNSKPRGSDIFTGTSLYANRCLTQVDSRSPSAALLKAGTYSSGTNCFVGSDGSSMEGISPAPEADCKALGDPFLNYALPGTGVCNFTGAEISGSGTDNKATVHPGTYCGGLSVEGDKVEFKPGVYRILNGPLEIKSDSSIKVKKDKHSHADGVTFIVTGTDASIQLEAQEIDLKAYRDGPAPSFIFYVKDTNGSKSEDSNIIAKQFLRFEGIIYAPKQHLQIRWSRPADEFSKYWDKAPSPFTSVIADSIDFHGYSQWGFEYYPDRTDLKIPKELLSEHFSPRLVD